MTKPSAAFCAICCADIAGHPIKQAIDGVLVDMCADCGTDEAVDTRKPGALAEHKRETQRTRQRRLLDAGLCINGVLHGPNVDGTRCLWCIAVYKRGITAVLADPNAPARPESKRRRSA